MSKEKYQPTSEEIRAAEESMTEEQRRMSERREKEEEIRELLLEVFKKNSELAGELVSGNSKVVKYFMKKQPTMTLEQLSSAELIEGLPRNLQDVSNDVSDKERYEIPTFEDLRRSAKPDVFTKFAVAFAKVMKGEFYVTTHQPFRNKEVSMRLWRQRPEVSFSGHPDWWQNHEKAVLEAWGGPGWVTQDIKELEEQLQSSGGHMVGGGDYVPYYMEYRMRGNQEKK